MSARSASGRVLGSIVAAAVVASVVITAAPATASVASPLPEVRQQVMLEPATGALAGPVGPVASVGGGAVVAPTGASELSLDTRSTAVAGDGALRGDSVTAPPTSASEGLPNEFLSAVAGDPQPPEDEASNDRPPL